MCISINLRCSGYVSWVPYWQIMLYLVNPHLEESYTSFRSLLAGHQEPYKSQLGPKKSSLASRMTVLNFIYHLLTSIVECVSEYMFFVWKKTCKQNENAKEEKRVSVENLIGIDFLQICFVYF